MSNSNEIFEEIIEGDTKLIVPKKSLTEKVPPIKPAFFNPKARTNRDFSIIAYAAFLKKFDGPKIFLEALSGVGARGLRVANELKIDTVNINDLNPTALKIAKESATLNNLKNIEFSEKEACVFLNGYSRKGNRGSLVDIDPFGSPAAFFDCGIRATIHGGILYFFRCLRSMNNMPAKYNPIIGPATSIIVTPVPSGVMTAPKIIMITIAYLAFFLQKSLSTISDIDIAYITSGS